MSHFSHFFRSSAQPLTLPKMVRCNVYVLCWYVSPHPLSFSCLWQGVETRFSVLSMQFRARQFRARRWTLKWTRLVCRSLSASLNLRSGFVQIGLLLKRLLWDHFLAQNCLWMQGMARVWLLDLRLQIEAVCASRLSVLLWQVRWSDSSHSWCWVLSFGCSCVLAGFKFGIFHSRDCCKVFESDVKKKNMIEMKSHVVI